MQQPTIDTTEPVKTQIARAGIVDQGTYQLPSGGNTAKFATETPADPEQMQIPEGARVVNIIVPKEISDEVLQESLQLGQRCYEAVARNQLMLVFPVVQRDPETQQPVRSIGLGAVPLLNNADLQRFASLAKVTREINVKLAQARMAKMGKTDIQAETAAAVQKDGILKDQIADKQATSGQIITEV